MSSPDLFEAYFQRADTDRDGRISGQEAVSFFQGANLQREVLAKIWQYADQGQTGYLSRAEFYNALKLVTVAQTGRELTPAIVSRALNGPAASQIPPPQIQFSQGSVPIAPLTQGVGPVQPLGAPMPTYPQYSAANTAVGPQPVASPVLNKQGNLPASTRSANIPSDLPTNKSSSWSGPPSNNTLNGLQGLSSMGQSISSLPQYSGANTAVVKSDADFFGGDAFKAVPVNPSGVSSQASSISAAPQAPQSSGSRNQMSQSRELPETDRTSFSLTSSSTIPPSSKVLQPISTIGGQQDRGSGSLPSSSDASKAWPKMTDAIVRRYTKIFFEVDTDKDGKISGPQARDLFLSWHLPREVLKQIWDLSDQDHDSMLSLREFCVALYLMERHREGRALPSAIPFAFYFDESGIQALRISEAQVAVAQNSAGYNIPSWRQNPGMLQSSGSGLPPRPVPHSIPGQSAVRAPVQATGRGGFVPMQMPQSSSKFSAVDRKSGPHLTSRDSYQVQSTHEEAFGSSKKESEKQFMDSKEKMEFYRSKLQDIVLFKTRCDNRLAEISDKATADKHEVESLAKRYDEKYKLAGESQSRLLADEAAFRDIQERRLELHNALVRMEQGGDPNAFLQVRAGRLQNDLNELKKVLTAKCKQFGLPIRPVSVLEIPFGWQSGIQESAAQWDEEWDKFEDEGFACVQEFMEEGTAGSDASKPKSVVSWDENSQQSDEFDPSSASANVNGEVSVYDKNQNVISSEEQQDKQVENGEQEVLSSDSKQSPRANSSTNDTWDPQKFNQMPSSPKPGSDDSLSNGGEWASFFSHAKSSTQPNTSWGGSDLPHRKASDSTSIQGAKPMSVNVSGFDEPFDNLSISSHETDDLPTFGPIRTKERPSVFFDASVPSTPLNSSYSPGPVKGGSFFDDSVPSTPAYSDYSTGFGSTREPMARFDSFSSVGSDFPHSSDSFARFDSFNYPNSGSSPLEFRSFDDHEPRGKTTFGAQQANRSTDMWSTFG